MDDIELIKQKINVVELISEYIPLKKAGINFKANCPFHEEKTPSFMVSPERGIWHCFGCDKGGDVFKFVMEKEGMEFAEALDYLAQKAGVVLKKNSGGAGKDSRSRLFDLSIKTKQFYNYLLLNHALGKKALDYLKKRGLKEEIVQEFELGYAPQNWETLVRFLKKRGFKNEEMIAAGVMIPSKNGGYDRFRGRIMYPLIDVKGQVLGFAGRILESGEPKYINSPQTALFDKSKFLFGINLSKGAIREKKSAIIAEGEMDMIMSYQSGVKNIVASKGTALTESQLELLKKYTDELILCFDTDLAGDSASRRGIELADQKGFKIKVISIEGAKDPAELCKSDPKKWEEAVQNATPIYDYYLTSVSQRYNLKDASSKREIFAYLLPIWKKISDPIEKEHYTQRLAAHLQVKEEFIRKHIEKLPAAFQPPTVNAPKQEVKDNGHILKDRHRLLEEYLIALLLHLPEDLTFIPNFPETLFTQEELKQLYVLLVLFLDSISFKGQSFKIAEFAGSLPESVVPLMDRLYLMQIDEKLTEPVLWQKEVENVVAELKKILIRSSLEKLSLQIKNAQEFDKMEALEILNKRFRDLSVRLKNL
jgi:DNA primase